jgi:HSP20 family protein
MSTLAQLREGLSRAWDNLAEGWHELRRRAGHALTHFTPTGSKGQLETAQEQLARGSSRWGLLAAEVSENDSEVIVRLEAPGMNSQDFDLQVVDDILVVRGEKSVEREEQRGRYYVTERAYGRFERAIPLPTPVEESRAGASYKRGVLRITLPKSPRAQARRIEVKVA